MKLKFLVPLLVFLALAGFLAVGLQRDPSLLPSPLVDKPAPAFVLPLLEQSGSAARFAPADMKGKVWMMNVWAAWCVSCREEHPLLMKFSQEKLVPLVGLDYKDQHADALKVLRTSGNPYDLVAFDAEGRVGIDYGVYGVPETYVIDKSGVIRFKQVGIITQETLDKTIRPLVLELQKS